VHRQTRPGLVVAGLFAVAAGVAVLIPHQTGPWLPLHLFLLGSMVHAISAVTVMLAVTWSAAPPPPRTVMQVQRGLLTAGVVGLVASREMGATAAAVAIAASAIAASLVILGGVLVAVRRAAVVDRFHPAIDGYLAALALAVLGSGLGAAAGTGHGSSGVVTTHLTVNLFGLVGMVIAATLPYMTATQVRSKMAPRATPAVLRCVLAVLVAATVLAAAGLATERPLVAGLGLLTYAAGIVATVAVCPLPRGRNLRWAGPRVGSLAFGVLWWIGTAMAFAISAAHGDQPSTGVVIALVVGGYAQILVGSLAYLAPVLRGGGHARLADGFRLTRSWPALVAANVAALGAVVGSSIVLVAGLLTVLGDSAVRAVLLARPRHGVA
jgi:nitrite reductase (NO-forming)